MYDPQSLTIRITYKCNIGCRFCYNTSLLGSDITLDEERMLTMIREAREAGITRMGISGGEAFLFAKQVVNMIKLAKEIGFTTVSIVTNGFWGKSEKSTENLLAMLKDAKFGPPNDMLSMSGGEYHQEWIPPSYAANIIRAYQAAYKMPFTIDFEYSNGKEHLVDEFKAFLKGEGIPDAWYKVRIRTFIAPLGRGKDLAEGSTTAKSPNAYAKCNAINRFVVQPDGHVVPCCGFNRFNPGINLGNIYEQSVAEVIKAGNTSIVNRYLTHVALRDIYKELAAHFDLPKEYAANCELCEALFAKPEHIEHLTKVAAKFLPPE